MINTVLGMRPGTDANEILFLNDKGDTLSRRVVTGDDVVEFIEIRIGAS